MNYNCHLVVPNLTEVSLERNRMKTLVTHNLRTKEKLIIKKLIKVVMEVEISDNLMRTFVENLAILGHK